MKQILATVAALVLLACGTPVESVEDAALDAPAQAAPDGGTPVTAPVIPAPVTVPEPSAQPAPAPLPAIRYWVEPGIDNRDEVIEGVKAWAESTRGVREWIEVDTWEGAELAVREIGPYGNTCGVGGAPPSAVGCAVTGGLWANESGEPMTAWLINSTRDDAGKAQPGYQQNAKLVTMHEIGHLLGLKHAPGGIMSATLDALAPAADWECPDAETIDELETHLKIDGLQACTTPEGN
jgi:hypothetical protein